mmetsp:Transcript_101546/g.219243  ORF Transcript_101546/g.219243 Transcript_101546/m.219243 type:complete len:248 (+) Transcript_101546:347-1090(+)
MRRSKNRAPVEHHQQGPETHGLQSGEKAQLLLRLALPRRVRRSGFGKVPNVVHQTHHVGSQVHLVHLGLEYRQHQGHALGLRHLLEQPAVPLVEVRRPLRVREVAELAGDAVGAAASGEVEARPRAQLGVPDAARVDALRVEAGLLLPPVDDPGPQRRARARGRLGAEQGVGHDLVGRAARGPLLVLPHGIHGHFHRLHRLGHGDLHSLRSHAWDTPIDSVLGVRQRRLPFWQIHHGEVDLQRRLQL